MNERNKLVENAVRNLQQKYINEIVNPEGENRWNAGQLLAGLTVATGLPVESAETVENIFRSGFSDIAIAVSENELQQEQKRVLGEERFGGDLQYGTNYLIDKLARDEIRIPNSRIQAVYEAFVNEYVTPSKIQQFYNVVGVQAERGLIENYVFNQILARTQADASKFIKVDPFGPNRTRDVELRTAFDISELALSESVILDNAKKLQIQACEVPESNIGAYVVGKLFSSIPQNNDGVLQQLFRDYFTAGFDSFTHAGKEGQSGFRMAEGLTLEGMFPSNQTVQQAYASKLEHERGVRAVFAIGNISRIPMNPENMGRFSEHVKNSPIWEAYR